MTKLKHNGILQLTALIFAVLFANSVSLAESVPPFVSVSSNSSIHFSSAVTLELQKPDDALQLECPADISTYTDINECTADISSSLNVNIISGTLASLTWEMTGATKGTSNRAGINQIERYVFNEGVTIIRYTARDNAENVTECQFTVTVTDNEAPIISAPKNLTIKCDGRIPSAHTTLQAFLNAGGFATDNCNLLVSSFALISEVKDNRNCPYSLTRTYQISDEYGNVGSVKQHIFVLDEEGLISQMAISNSGATATISYTKSDVTCRNDNNGFVQLIINGTSGILSYIWSSGNGDGIIQGEKDQTSLSDGDYNVKVFEDDVYLLELNINILVADNEFPIITCPADITIECGQNVPAAFTNLSQFENAGGKASDNCQLNYASFRMLSETKSRQICPYILTRTYQISDVNGNVGKAEHFIFVNEDTEPQPQQPLTLKSGMAGTVTAKASGNWSDPNTWDTGTVPAFDDDVIIPNGYTVTVNVAAICKDIAIQSGGTIIFSGTNTLQINGNILNNGTITLGDGKIIDNGNWTNNGIFTSGTNGIVDFTGSSPATISGTSTTVFKDFIISKGAVTNILQVNSNIELGGDITFTSGLMQVNTGAIVTGTHNEGFIIKSVAGLLINGGTFISGPYSIDNEGLLQIDNGTLTIGSNLGNGIVVKSSGTLDVNGGTLNVAGRLEVSGGNVDISGGTINLNTVGYNSSTKATLDLSLASDFNMTDGTINFLNSNGSGFFDVLIENSTGSKTISDGTFNFGDGSDETYKISSAISFPNITTTTNVNLELRRLITSTGTYAFPLFDGSGSSIPVTVNLNSGTIGSGAYIEVETSGEHPNNNSATHYLKRTWAVTTNGIISPNYDVSAKYADADINLGASETEIAFGSWTGSTPLWIKENVLDAVTNTIAKTGITTSSITFTGITLDAPTVTISATDDAICVGESTSLTANPIGDSEWTYSWSPVSSTDVSVNVSPVTTTTYIVTVTDGNGFTATDDITVTVNIPPSFSDCPVSPISLNTTTGDCSAIAVYTVTATGTPSPTYSYSFSGITTGNGSGTATDSSFNIGSTTVTVTATNSCGSIDCVFDVSVTDNENPVISCPGNISANVGAGICGAVVTYSAPVGIDNCAGASTVQTAGLASGSTFPAGTTTNTFVVTDAAGNTASCSFDVIVTDNENPAISCPANISVNVSAGICGAVVTYTAPVGTDNCTGATTVQTAGLVSGSTFPIGVTTNTFEVTDAVGNKTSCSFNVTVTDNEAPVITGCPANITVYTGPGRTTCNQVATWTAPTATDNCTPIGSLNWTNPLATSGNLFPVGVSTITYIVADAAGNKDTCSFTITVIDNTPPVPPSAIVPIAVNCQIDTIIPPVATDNCDGIITGTTTQVYPITTQGQTKVYWTFTDIHNNVTTVSQTVSIIDDIPPKWDFPNWFINVVNKNCEESTHPDFTGYPTATDNCYLDTIIFSDTITRNPFDCESRYKILRRWVAIDSLGNKTDPKVQTIQVNDNTPPVLICRDTFVNTPNDIWPADSLFALSFYDNCGIDTVFLDEEQYIFNDQTTAGFCPDTVLRWYTVLDRCGKFSNQCLQRIAVLTSGGCEKCQEDVPYELADLNGNPDSLWLSQYVKREGICCDVTQEPGEGPPKCVSFNVYLDEDAVGLVFDIDFGASPPGALFYQIDCGPEIPVGEIICLAGGQYYTVTFCKPGNNKNIYSIQSIPGAVVADSLRTRADIECFGNILVEGLDTSTINWSVKYPPGADELLRYLDTTIINNPTFYPDSITPALIIYEVCGQLLGAPECDSMVMWDCADIIISTFPPVNINLDVDLAAICVGEIPEIEAEVPIEDPTLEYDFTWYLGSDGTGTPVDWDRYYTPPDTGTYSVRVVEVTSGVGCASDITNFNISYDLEGPILLVPPDTLIIDCSHPNPIDTMLAWAETARAFEAEDTTIRVDVYYDPASLIFTPHCSLAKVIYFEAEDACNNVSRDSAYIFITDTVPPTIFCPRDTSNFAELDSCFIRDFALLPPEVYDACDPDNIDITWEKTGATSGNGSGTVTGPFNVGITTVIYTATDLCGNIDTCSQRITIRDIQAPNIIVCPEDEEVSAPPPGCEMEVLSIDSIVAFDNCTGLALDLFWIKTDELGDTIATGPGYVNGTLFPAGVTYVRYIVTDLYGNADSSCIFTVTVNDTVPPTIINCPPDVAENVEDSCELYVVVPSPTYSDPCGEIVDVRHNSIYTGANDSVATGTYPVGIHEIVWTFTDKWGNDTTCVQIIEIVDIQPVVLNCPSDFSLNTVFGEEYTINITIPEPVHDDNCDYVLYWGMVDSTGVMIDTSHQIQPINMLTSYDTLYVGVYTVTYSLIDINGDTIVCDFDITIEAAPIIDCAPDTIVWAADSVCTNTFDPGIPDLLVGSAPIDWTWVMTGVNTGSGFTNDANVLPDPIGEVEFNLGKTIIRWTATNTSGTDTCYQYIEVRDTIRPIIAELDSLEDCIEPIQMAIYNVADDDLYLPDRPDYMIFAAGDTALDLTIIDRGDNCNLANCPDSISWRIDISSVTDQNGVVQPGYSFTGSGQLSDYGSVILFPGDGTYMNAVDHTITYWITDCAGNVSFAQKRKITVLPRPKIIKMN